jgi:hypothetical protein
MNLESNAVDKFFDEMEIALPGLREILAGTKNEIYLLGAGVFELFASCEWCEELSRATSDLDFSLEIVGDVSDYHRMSEALQKIGYKKDVYHKYRYNSPSKMGRFVYVDLLTFTTDKNKEAWAKSLIGVGEDFSFQGMSFAKLSPLHLDKNIYSPNPLAFILLKIDRL